MKKNHLLLFILLLGYLGLKAQETIDNPPYKFRNTALYRIEKVECTDQDTKVYLRTEFIPGWWVQFSKEEINLKDNLGNRYQPLALEGAAWEEQKPTPASGTDHFIFTFPPLSSGVTSIDFLEGKSGIFDIRLTGDIPSVQTPLPTTLTGNWLTTDGSNRWTYGFYPEFVIEGNRFWAYEKIETKGKKLILHLKSEGQHRQLLLSEQKDGYYKIGTSRKTQRLYKREDYRMEQVSGNQAEKSFFQPGSKAYIQGYIRGYDPRAGFTSGIIYNNNIVTEEDFPTVVALLEDGHFSAELSLDNPTSGNISFTPRYPDDLHRLGRPVTGRSLPGPSFQRFSNLTVYGLFFKNQRRPDQSRDLYSKGREYPFQRTSQTIDSDGIQNPCKNSKTN